MKIEPASARDILGILRSVPGVDVVLPDQSTGDAGVDAVIHGAGTTHPIVLEYKRQANAATAHQLGASVRRPGACVGLVLVAQSTTQEARRLLQEYGIGVVDGQGYVHIELPGLLLHVEPRHDRGHPRRANPTQPSRLAGKAGIVAQALLLEPQRPWTVTDLAERTAVSTGLTHRVLTRLEREGIVTTAGAGPHRTRQVRDPAALLDLWAEEAEDRRVERVRAFRLGRDPGGLAGRASTALREAGVEHAVTGPAAAHRLAPFVTAVPVVDIWVTQQVDLMAAAGAAGAELVETGHNLLLAQAEGDGPLVFRADNGGLSVVNRFRLYLDLLHEPRRGREQAERLRQEVIGF